MQADFANLKPLNPSGLVGFSKFRDPNEKSNTNGASGDKAGKKRQTDADSDDEDVDVKTEVTIKTEGDDTLDAANGMLSPEDAKRQAELAQGVQKIRVSEITTIGVDADQEIAETTTLDRRGRCSFASTSKSKVTLFKHSNGRVNPSSHFE